jgi:hypothetical protein
LTQEIAILFGLYSGEEVRAMATPIRPTPVLKGEEALAWRKKIDSEKQKKVGPVPTPELDDLRRAVLADAKKRSE